LRADMRRDWIIAANMEYQPLRYRLSGHCPARDSSSRPRYPRLHASLVAHTSIDL
jgi:hypothetical protein